MTITFRPGEEMDWIEAETFFIESYPAGRVCDHDGCDTVLSIYNPDPHCGAHRPEPDWHYCGYDFGLCEDCGEVIRIRKDRPGTTCGPCRNERRRANGLDIEPEPEPEPSKTCIKCGYTGDDDDFRPRTSVCRDCERKQKLDHYYLTKYGQTRAEYRGSAT